MLDYLIIGQGIAGTLLSFEMQRRGLRYLIVDRKDTEISSRVAAGIWAPLTGLHVSRGLFAHETLSSAQNVYPQMEKYVGAQFYHPRRVFRVFKSSLQRERWLAQRGTATGREFLGPYLEPHDFPHEINAPRGGIEVKGGGWLDTAKMVDSMRLANLQQGRLQETTFNSEELNITDDCIRWRDVQARNIIFCTGPAALKQGPFDYVPFKATRGDVLTIRTAKPSQLTEIYHGARFLVPLGERLFRVGASYVHNEVVPKRGAAERVAIENDIRAMLRQEFETVEHRAGLRPNTLDNVAVVGAVPYDRRILILNGLGSKGVLQAPWMAGRLLDYSMNGRPLPESIDVARFLKRWKKAWLQRA